MATKKPPTKAGKPEVLARKEVECAASATDAKVTASNYARLVTSPELAAYRVIACNEHKDMHKMLDVPTLVQALKDQGAAANRNDMSQAEAMLMNQATALQTLFARMAERATGADYMPNLEAFMRIALKAQSQCRATLETLATIKNPPTVYAKQANVTTGPQQVNNVTQAKSKISQTNYWRPPMATTWTPQRRQRQRELIQTWRPWAQSTGPKTTEGKAAVSRNAYREGITGQLRELRQAMRQQQATLRALV